MHRYVSCNQILARLLSEYMVYNEHILKARTFYLICCDDLHLSGSAKEQRGCPERCQKEGDIPPKRWSNVGPILAWTNENFINTRGHKQLRRSDQTVFMLLSPMTTPGMWTIWWAMEEPAHSRPRLRYDFLHDRKSEVSLKHRHERLWRQRKNLPREHAVDDNEEEDEVNDALPVRHHQCIGSG